MANQVSWFEISGKDGAKLQQFYGDLFGWKIDANNPMHYGVVEPPDGGIGGGIGQSSSGGTQVTFYVGVDDLQACLDNAERSGGRTVLPVTEIPNMATIAQFADPEGNVVGIVKPQQN